MASPAPIRRLADLTYDVVTRRYRRANGRFLSTDDVLATLERELVAAKVRFRALGQELIDGRVNLASFQIQLEQMSKRVQLVGAAIERGGFAQMTGGDLGFVGSRVRATLGFVRDFMREIETGKQRLDGRLLARLDQYALEGRASARAMARRIAVQDGHKEEKSVLGIADHCRASGATPGCIEEARRGWRPIGTLAPPGRRTCRNNCRCHLTFRGGRAAA